MSVWSLWSKTAPAWAGSQAFGFAAPVRPAAMNQDRKMKEPCRRDGGCRALYLA